MQKLTLVLSLILALTVAPALAMNHNNSDHGSHGPAAGAAQHAGHAGMLDLGAKVEKGVKGAAHLDDVRAAMAKAGQKGTHHLMVMFSDEKSGKALEAGKVAVKVTAPGGTVTGPLELIGMAGHFGADLILDQPGEYRFEIGSRLADGMARQFVFTAVIK